MLIDDLCRLFGLWTSDQRKVYKQLSAMDRRLLDDMGITQGDIRNIVEDMEE